MLAVTSIMRRDDALEKIERFDKALGLFKEVSPSLSAGQIETFLLVAMNEGKSLGDLAKMAGHKSSTMSRYLLELSDKLRDGGAGYDLVDRRTDPMELRRNQYFVSRRGKDLLRRIVTTLYT